MKKLCNLCCILLFFGVAAPGVFAQDRGVGVGLTVGEPTGLSLKGWLTERAALAGAAAWSFDSNTSFHLHCDYLIHEYGFLDVGSGRLPVYYGIGARVKFDDHRHRRRRTRTGVRIPVGLNYHFERAPVDLFLEVAPTVDVAPKTGFGLNGAIGTRLFF